ncbi:metallophosphoesterase [Curtobacterium sp. S6]|uniref:metallophosphoesterase n=1 Tax=Curtobacterium sp. S6 TaxID=1479623 RepID=UPI0004AB85B2
MSDSHRPAAPAATVSVPAMIGGAGLLAAAGAASVVAYGHFVELNRFHVREETLAVLPPGSPELRILHISDMHMIPGQRRKTRFMHGLADLQPDLVINTGDNLSHLEGLAPLLNALGPLMDFPGVYVPGSNCYFAPKLKNPARYLWRHTGNESRGADFDALPFEAMHAAFEARGWRGLINRTDSLTIGGVRLDFSGVDDPHLGYDRHPGFAPLPHGVDPEVPAVRIGVMHAPYVRTIRRFVADGAQVMFAGHTHGGQICLPGGRALVSNCDLDPSRAKGVSYEDSVPLEVSAGLGTSRFAPVRLFCPPEAVLVRLTVRDAL